MKIIYSKAITKDVKKIKDQKLIDKIIASQLERSEKQEKADNIITNDGSVDELKQKIKIFHDNIIKRLQND